MTGEARVPVKAADGYDMCPDCGHHTSAAVAGICTVFIPDPDARQGEPLARYCNCDCYKALHGISLMDKIFGTATPGEDD